MANYAKQALAQNVNVVSKVQTSLTKLLEVLGKTDVTVVAPGTAVKIYKSAGTLASGTVAEGAEIPLSDIKMEPVEIDEITYSKYRKLTGIETIGKQGYDLAVTATNTAMLKDVQKSLRKSIYAGIAKGTGTATAATFQAAAAAAWGKVSVAFEDDAATPVFFVNPMDVAAYLGTAAVTVQTAFGLNYIQNFLGLGNALIDSNVPQGTVIGTAVENIDVLAPSITAIAGMEMSTDASGIIAVHNGAKYENGGIQTVVYTGLAAFPVFLDRVVKVTIGA